MFKVASLLRGVACVAGGIVRVRGVEFNVGVRGEAARRLGRSRVEMFLAAYAAHCRGFAAQFGDFAAVFHWCE